MIENENTPGKDQKDPDGTKKQDNGIKPLSAEVAPDPQKSARRISGVENADEDRLNPYPDEMKTDDTDSDRVKSTWMISGQNRKI